MGQTYSSQLNETSRINYNLIYPYKNTTFAPQKQGNSSGTVEGRKWAGEEVGRGEFLLPFRL